MLIHILEPTGIRHEGLGHMRKGETRDVPDELARFFIANGWAEDPAGKVSTGERGKLDLRNPAEWSRKSIAESGAEAPEEDEKKEIQPSPPVVNPRRRK